MKEKQVTNHCLFPNCNNGIHVRGLCSKHYIAALRFVRSGKTSWEKLEKSGKAHAKKSEYYSTSLSSWFLGKDVK